MLAGQNKRFGVPKLRRTAVIWPSLHHPMGLRELAYEDADIPADILDAANTPAT